MEACGGGFGPRRFFCVQTANQSFLLSPPDLRTGRLNYLDGSIATFRRRLYQLCRRRGGVTA